MRRHRDIAPRLRLEGTLIVSARLMVGAAQAIDTAVATQAATDTARLWRKPPTTHTDGSALRVDRFEVHTRRSPEERRERIATVDAKQASYTVRNLALSMHYFAVTAVCKHGWRSAFSNIARIASKEISPHDANQP